MITMTMHAVFFDPTRRRWRWIKGVATLAGVVATILVSVFLVSILSTPLLPNIPSVRRAIRKTLHASVLPRRQTKLARFLADRARRKLIASIERERRKRPTVIKSPNIVAAFYAPWQETGLHSLRANAGRITHLLPAWVQLNDDGSGLDFHDWDPALTPHNADALAIARANNIDVVPVLSNAQLTDFDPARAHALLTRPELQDRVIAQLLAWVVRNRFQGINVDFENLATSDHRLLLPFLQKLRAAFAPHGLSVSLDLEASSPLDWRRASQLCDFVIVMAYDEHSSTDKPGPISSLNWYRAVLRKAAREIPRDKLVVGLANYAYDWSDKGDEADALTYQEALVRSRDYRPHEPTEHLIDFDAAALNPTYTYTDENGDEHEVWMLDAVTAANEWSLAEDYTPRGVALWVLGSMDPSVFTFVSRTGVHPNAGALRTLAFPYDVEFDGEGEILRVRALPSPGSRSLAVDPRSGLIVDEVYHRFPTSFVISRSGYHPKLVALTFDDGPAETYTAAILDVLEQNNIKATFFLIGENADRYPDLVRRIWREGHEIGNHTYTHPNIAAVGDQRARAELNATQRVIQSLTGRSTVLFRPPYNADAEPTSAEEVRPIVLASQQDYVVVGEYIDPEDWNLDHHRTAHDMLRSTLAQLDAEHGSCILLHDGGGNRSETVKLLPALIHELRKRGYEFVPVSRLMSATRDQVNPPVTSKDSAILASDRIVFEVTYLADLFLTLAFISAIVLGSARVVFVTSLALLARRREKSRTFDPAFSPSVSVVIAAYNEEKVIVRTIDAVLASRYPLADVVVVDDGSTDGTSEAVSRRFAARSDVTLLRQENAGKAAALNRGIATARGEIIITLDADTLFRVDTIEKLVRRFEDPRVGAVAGNVKVGNRNGPLTWWQAIEYITSQNLDRRAYAAINGVAVVPGAVGAWRRDAIVQAGGCASDTMAEDMDLTWRTRRDGWRIENESDAVGFTEAPDSIRALFKQRFRWAFGTLQSLWKHRDALGRYGWFGRVTLPSLWLFQVVYQALSPLVDLEIAWTLGTVVHAAVRGHLTHDWQPWPLALDSLYLVAFMYAFFFAIELVGSAIAFQLDREDRRMLVWLFWQRFVYRQLMYAVLLKSLQTAFSGMRAGWGKLERKGTVEVLS